MKSFPNLIRHTAALAILSTTAAAWLCPHAVAQTAALKPEPGQWEFQMNMSGMPMGGEPKVGKTCLTAQQLAQPEQGFVNAAMLAMRPPKEGATAQPGCQLSNIQRDADKASWAATCEGPRGAMNGSGSGQIQAQQANFTQRFEINLMGKRTLQQTVTAKRLGACS